MTTSISSSGEKRLYAVRMYGNLAEQKRTFQQYNIPIFAPTTNEAQSNANGRNGRTTLLIGYFFVKCTEAELAELKSKYRWLKRTVVGPVTQEQIDQIRRSEPVPQEISLFAPGVAIRIVNGPMADWKGTFFCFDTKNKRRATVKVSILGRSTLVDVLLTQIEPA